MDDVDDVLIHTQTLEEHKKVLDEVFKRLEEAGVTVNKDKCRFYEKEVEF